jgi:hypothetical protein
MQTKLYPNKKVAAATARTLKACQSDYAYVVGRATDKPSPVKAEDGYFCIRVYLGKDFFKFA